MQRIQSIEEILAGMKSRLNQVESNLVAEIGPESAEAALALVDMRGSSAATTVRVGTAASAANDSHAGQKSAASTPKQQPGGGPGATAPPGRPAVPPINAAATKEAASSALGYS